MEPNLLFAKTYIRCLNAFASAKLSGINFEEKPSGYYVYFLLHPITGKIIYVGKGKGKRKDAHLLEYYNCTISNYRKHESIGKIIDEGFEPISVIFKKDLSEQEAYQLEAFFIEYFNDYDISNIERGQQMTREQSQEIAKMWLSRIMDFDKWCSIAPRNEIQKELYWLIKNGLEKITDIGNIVNIISTTRGNQTSVTYEYC